MSDEHTITELRCEILDLEEKLSRQSTENSRIRNHWDITSELLTDKCDELKALSAEDSRKNDALHAVLMYLGNNVRPSGPSGGVREAIEGIVFPAVSGTQEEG